MRKLIDKPYAGGQWSVARMRSFVMSALRRAQWPVKYQAVKLAFVKAGINPSTGRMCKLHKCEQCLNLFPQKDMAVDHIDPVVPIEGFDKADGFLGYDWDQVIRRLYCESEGLQILCKPCHKAKTIDERAERAAYAKSKKNSK
jgi:5-methylcytosine-specific restriction endonuclease McrA